MEIAKEVDQARSSPEYDVEEEDKVVRRDDHIYAEGVDELMEIYRSLQNVLDELGFDEISEFRAEQWESLPFKFYINAFKWKDPYTAIKFWIKIRVKEPRSDRKTGEEVYKGKLTMRGYISRVRYPQWNKFEETTRFTRSGLYRFFWKLANSFIFAKEREKYEEEAEELAVQFMSRLREMEESVPAIGRSKREWYNPEGK
ncbi:MAG: hypothetical protein SVQ76_01885 [Candidatus Nanohaloarchaea archaeon]|nr:hypothetical protein [Candidatus Nanohaloarchaea archaeon]